MTQQPQVKPPVPWRANHLVDSKYGSDRSASLADLKGDPRAKLLIELTTVTILWAMRRPQ